MQQTKRHKKTLCSHPSCSKRAQYPSTLCWRHGAKDVVCSFDGCNKGGILLGLCPDHGGLVQLCRWRDASTRSTWKDGVECVGCIMMTRPIAIILKRKRVKTME